MLTNEDGYHRKPGSAFDTPGLSTKGNAAKHAKFIDGALQLKCKPAVWWIHHLVVWGQGKRLKCARCADDFDFLLLQASPDVFRVSPWIFMAAGRGASGLMEYQWSVTIPKSPFQIYCHGLLKVTFPLGHPANLNVKGGENGFEN